jgi:hypothetical protein
VFKERRENDGKTDSGVGISHTQRQRPHDLLQRSVLIEGSLNDGVDVLWEKKKRRQRRGPCRSFERRARSRWLSCSLLSQHLTPCLVTLSVLALPLSGCVSLYCAAATRPRIGSPSTDTALLWLEDEAGRTLALGAALLGFVASSTVLRIEDMSTGRGEG